MAEGFRRCKRLQPCQGFRKEGSYHVESIRVSVMGIVIVTGTVRDGDRTCSNGHLESSLPFSPSFPVVKSYSTYIILQPTPATRTG